jgi:dipeptidyl aminopeptidase/acylaminoacyl peptidase
MPPSPTELEAFTRALLELPSAQAVDADDAGRVLVRWDTTGTFQLYELDPSDETPALRALTDLPEGVDGAYVPGRRQAVIAADTGGNERTQLYRLDVGGPPVTELSSLMALTADDRFVHQLAGVSPGGKHVAFVSNRRNGIDFDVWLADLKSGEQRCLYDQGGWCHPASGWSPDGRFLSIIRSGERPLDESLLLIEVDSGTVVEIDPHPDEAALVGPPAWLDTTTFIAASSVGRDVQALVRYDLATGGSELVVSKPDGQPGWDQAAFASRDGATLLAVTNEDGATSAVFVDPSTGEAQEELPLPEPGVLAMGYGCPPPLLSENGSSVVYTFSSPVRPPGVWRFDRATTTTQRLTEAASIPPEDLVGPSRMQLASFDGENIPVAVYRPRDRGPEPITGQEVPSSDDPGTTVELAAAPVIVSIHGGPESQAMLSFGPMVQALVSAGIAVVVPNVRGSTGYGKRFASLDDTTRRLDSVADLGAIHDWLPTVGLDPDRAGLYGGSYGGYMVLAGCAFQPRRWGVGVEQVGISNLVTFLEHTSEYRRAHREREYGSLERDRAFLEAASPLNRVDDIRAPLFVIHGANDPRVPLSEAQQLAASLRRRGVPCELLVYEDEGHGLAKRANKLDAFPRVVTFVISTLGL